jgi:PrtD family type I secretion system ABC transporter
MIQIYNRVLPTRSEESLIWLTLLIFALFISMSAIDMARHQILVRFSKVFEAHTTKKTMRLAVVSCSAGTSPSGTSILRDIDHIRRLLTKGHLVSLLDILWFPIFVAALGYLHPALAGWAIVSGIWLALIALFSHITVTPTMENARIHAINAHSVADQIFAKSDIVQALGMRSALIERWMRRRSQAVLDHTTANYRLAAISSISKSSRMLAQSVTLGLGAFLAIHDALSIGAIIAGSVLVGRALAPIETSIVAYQDLMKAWRAYGRLTHFSKNNVERSDQLSSIICQGSLSVDSFSYSVDNHNILKNINFEAKPGEMVAIVGPSGSGKTTLARHLVGACRTACGSVRLDELEIQNLSDDLRSRYLGYVPQDIQLFDGTILENICRFGNPVPEEVVATAQLAGVHKMILRLPQDYGTQVGADGVLLSAGQRQRLALARALYGNPVFVVLDEPCAHMDETNERMLLQTLSKLKERNITVCLVTHKINLIRIADRVLILNARGDMRLGTPGDLFNSPLRPVTTDRRKAVG